MPVASLEEAAAEGEEGCAWSVRGQERQVFARVHTEEVLLGHLPGLDLYDFFVQRQQIPAIRQWQPQMGRGA